MNGEIGRPHLIDVHQNTIESETLQQIQMDIRNLFKTQPFAVLATQGKDVTDASLVTIAVSEDLKHIVFATPVRTGKYDLIVANENVSMLMDDRTMHQDNINQISALTVFGKAKVLLDENEIRNWGKLLADRHPSLAEFAQAPTSAIVLIHVTKYLIVKHFQDIWEWKLEERSI